MTEVLLPVPKSRKRKFTLDQSTDLSFVKKTPNIEEKENEVGVGSARPALEMSRSGGDVGGQTNHGARAPLAKLKNVNKKSGEA